MGESRGATSIPKGSRTLDIRKLGACADQNEVNGVTVIWTAKQPGQGPVIVGLYDNATVFRFMPPDSPDERPFIAKARTGDCRLVPITQRGFSIFHKKRGFPGMAAAWFPGEHQAGPARDFLTEVAGYISSIRRHDPVLPG
jgi:hypothetical protein